MTSVDNAAGAYTGCHRSGKPVSQRRRQSLSALARPLTPRLGSCLSMDSFELNKILGAILGTCLILLALNIAAGAIFAPEKPSKPGFNIAVKEAESEKGGPNRVGPNLWNIVNRPRASEAGFNYSAAMKGKPGNWSFDDLSKFLANPRGYIPGTNMTFAGLSRAEQRADVIDYLRTLADNPVPVPKAAEAAPAGGEQKK